MRLFRRDTRLALLVLVAWLGSLSILEAQESPFIYGIHDHDTNIQEYLDHFSNEGVRGWVTATIAIGSDPSNTGGDDFTWIANQGHTVIVRLNNGYCGDGTLPTSDKYDAFAQRAANYVAASRGADIFVIGNETNLAGEWPAVNGHAKYISPQQYASAFRKAYNAIKAVRPDARVLSQGLAPFAGPYNTGSTCGYTHDANPLNWVQYMNQMLTAIKSSGGIDGIGLHINSRGYTHGDIHSTQKVTAGGQSLYFSFYVYKDWVDFGIPKDLYHLPLYATESNGIFYWSGGHPERPDSHYEPGWMQEVYAEINRYNQQAAATGKPIYRAVNMYRWCQWCDGWNINGSPFKGQILSDLDQALGAQYRWPTGATPPPPPPPPPPAGNNVARGAINWSASSVYASDFGGANAYDGVVSAGSKWTSNGASAESWLALDLGGEFDVTGFIVRHASAGGEPAIYNTTAFRLERGASLTGPWTTLATVTNTSQSASSTTTLASAQTMRWVRLTITDAGIDNYARIPELEVYGSVATPPPPPPPTPTGDNVALGSVGWSASSTYNAGSAGHKAYDGDISSGSKWTSNGASAESWLALDLGGDFALDSFIVRHAGAGGEPTYFNTAAFRLESGSSLSGPWTTLTTVTNSAQANTSTATLASAATTRYVRLYITDAGIDNYARIPELEVYGAPATTGGNLITNGGFDASGLSGWTVCTERGSVNATVTGGRLAMSSTNHNGGVYQQFATGGSGATIDVDGFWESSPAVPGNQWAEVLVINGPRLPVNGQDVSAADADVVLVYKNDTWATPGGWSGTMNQTSPVVNAGSFVAAGPTATILLKSGNVGGALTGARFDDISVVATGSGPPHPPPPPPSAGAWQVLEARSCNGTCDFAQIKADLNAVGNDLAFVKIGFHVSPTGNQTGLGAWEQTMHDAGVPLFLKSVDSAGQIWEVAQLKAASGCVDNSRDGGAPGCVPHQLVYRKTVDVPYSGNPDCSNPPPANTPYREIYNETPYEAATAHWQIHRNAFPPELEPYKHLIWIETVNEINRGGTCDFDGDGVGGEPFPHNVGLVDPVFGQYTKESEWIAEFSIHTANLAAAEGFNWAAFGWSSGEPEIGSWAGPVMREFLELAAMTPARVAIATHEYSYTTDGLELTYPHLLGRHEEIFEVADHYGIARPTIVITEFGWTLNDIPSVTRAMNVDLPWAARLYAPHHEIQGASIWYLGAGWGGIDNEVQQLIGPLADYATKNYFVLAKAATP
jgi:hypothetical protein